MRAAVLRTSPGHLDIADLEVAAPGPNEVLIHTVAAGLCHSDVGFLDGREGLLLHLYHAAYVSWKYAKAWELQKPE